MKFEQIKDESSEGFRRLTGIKYTTFDVMVKILGEAEAVLKAQGGKPNKVSIENRLLMALEYLREYRTYFHISRSYGISESTCYRNIRWVEDTLIKDGAFSLMPLKHPLNDLKKTKKNPLTKEDKKNNRELSSERVLNENVIGMVKRFKIIADRYRNRRKRFGLRFNLIAGIYNFEL